MQHRAEKLSNGVLADVSHATVYIRLGGLRRPPYGIPDDNPRAINASVDVGAEALALTNEFTDRHTDRMKSWMRPQFRRTNGDSPTRCDSWTVARAPDARGRRVRQGEQTVAGRTRRYVAISALLAFAAILAACSDAGVADSRTPGVPTGIPVDGLDLTPAVHLQSDGSIAVVTWGSSSCPPTATAFDNDGGSLVVSFSTSSQGVCTADLAATTHIFSVDRVGDTVPHQAAVSFPELGETKVVEITRP